MYALLQERDATLVEMNPLVQLDDGSVVALDAKVTVDDNALFRHPDVEAYADAFPIDPVQARANEAGLQYVKLDGSVGIIGNGAGLVMSTLDMVAQAGARAANFLDVGGGASADQMATSLEVVLSDPAVRAVFINIFGGITRCDLVAKGMLGSARPGRCHRAARGAPRRHERRAGAGDPRRSREPAHRAGRDDARGGRAGGVDRERGGGVSILVGADTRLVVQGLTGKEGTFHTLRNRDYGTHVVAGVTPGKGGHDVEGIPVFDTVADAVRETGANTSMIFVPPRFAAEAILEAVDAGVGLVVCITEGIPVKDMAHVHSFLQGRGTTLVGPNCPGVDLARGVERRHHPARGVPAGTRRLREPIGHARLPDRARAHPAGDRAVDVRRHGRGPGARHRLHRVARGVRGRPRAPT